MSRVYNTVKRSYDKGYYSKEDVASFVKVGLISPLEYEKIVGEPFQMGEQT